MRIIITAMILLLFLLASTHNAQTPAPTGTIPSIFVLTGTVSADYPSSVNVSLRNIGAAAVPPFTVTIANDPPFLGRYDPDPNWTCTGDEYQFACSRQVASLEIAESKILTAEHGLATILPCVQPHELPSPIDIVEGSIEEGSLCWTRDLSLRASALVSDTVWFDLQVPKPLVVHECACLSAIEPAPTPTATPVTKCGHAEHGICLPLIMQ